MKKNVFILCVVMIGCILAAGCASQPSAENQANIITPRTTIRDLHNVKFYLVDQNNSPIENAYVTAVYNTTSYAGDSITPNNNRGYTDEKGNLTFVMRGSFAYNITISNLRDGQTANKIINPVEIEYDWIIGPTPQPTPIPPPRGSWADYQENNWITKTSRALCPFIPYVNDAFNC